jgi:hypothetical protein
VPGLDPEPDEPEFDDPHAVASRLIAATITANASRKGRCPELEYDIDGLQFH